MGRYIGSVCRFCRREGMKLFLKGDRCFTTKCAFERRGYAPGQHGQAHPKITEYSIRLREKQKVKRMYGIMERQFKIYFERAERLKGRTGEKLLILLERRLDNVIYRLGFASTRAEARMFVRHGHFLVNGKKVTIPSYLVNQNDEIVLKEKSRENPHILSALESAARRPLPSWLELDRENFRGKVIALPMREDITIPVKEQLIVELYSK